MHREQQNLPSTHVDTEHLHCANWVVIGEKNTDTKYLSILYLIRHNLETKPVEDGKALLTDT